MRLVLTIAGRPRPGKSGQPDNACFTDRGGTIGRGEDNDWVLPDSSQEVSRHHATVHFLDGGFYLEDTSANGIGIDDPDNLLAAGTLKRLEDGQCLYIGPYRINVSVGEHVVESTEPERTRLPRSIAAAASNQPRARTTQPEPSPEDDAFQRVLRQAGIPSDLINAERVDEVGRILFLAVQGIVDLLRARTAFQNELRVSVTTLSGVDDNPLKLSTNAEDALHNLLVKHNPDYLDAAQAFGSALADLQAHQQAIIEGLREAHNAMLKRFDPGVLEDLFAQQQGRRLGGQRSLRRRAWSLYKEYFAALTESRDAGFGRLFQEAFGRAYEARVALGRSQQKRSAGARMDKS